MRGVTPSCEKRISRTVFHYNYGTWVMTHTEFEHREYGIPSTVTNEFLADIIIMPRGIAARGIYGKADCSV